MVHTTTGDRKDGQKADNDVPPIFFEKVGNKNFQMSEHKRQTCNIKINHCRTVLEWSVTNY